MFCKNCGSENIEFSTVQTGYVTKGKSQELEKSALEKASQQFGRSAANMMTGGIYGVVAPKRKNTKHVSTQYTYANFARICTCKDCGKVWNADSLGNSNIWDGKLSVPTLIGLGIVIFMIVLTLFV